MRTRFLADTTRVLPFLLVSSTDKTTAITGITPTVTLSKNGATFTSATGTIAEIGNGWYKLTPSAADVGTLGSLVLHATGTGADPADVEFEVIAINQFGTPGTAGNLLIAGTNAPTTFDSIFVNGAVQIDTNLIVTESITADAISASRIEVANAALKYDASGYHKISEGTGAGQLKVTSGKPWALDSNGVVFDSTLLGGPGHGASVVTITVNDGTDPIQGAIVALTSNGVLNGSGVTNASGVVPLTPDSGDITYTVAIAKAQHSFTPTTLAVSGATARTYSMSAITITPAADPDQTTGYLTTRDGHGTAKASVTIGFRLIKGPGDAGSSYDTAQFTATSNGSGRLEVALLRDATYVGIRGDGREFEFVTGTESTHLLPENLGVDDA